MSYFFHRYTHLVRTRPLATNVVSTGILFAAGDLLAQTVENRQKPGAGGEAAAPTPAGLDLARTSRASVYGAFVFAPLAGTWFKFLSTVTVGANAAVNTVARVALDQFVFAPTVAIPLYFSVMTALEDQRDVVQRVRAKLHSHWKNTLLANWSVWPAVQLLNFGVVPVDMRLLVVNVVSIGWNCYLSMANEGDV